MKKVLNKLKEKMSQLSEKVDTKLKVKALKKVEEVPEVLHETTDKELKTMQTKSSGEKTPKLTGRLANRAARGIKPKKKHARGRFQLRGNLQ
jgi:hypothetical protein